MLILGIPTCDVTHLQNIISRVNENAVLLYKKIQNKFRIKLKCILTEFITC